MTAVLAFTLWKNDLRHYLITLNLVALVALAAYVIWAVLSPRRTVEEGKEAPNLTPFLGDEALEGRRLERVQGWALVFAAVTAVALPVYWLREPTREKDSVHYFDRNAVARGATLFANSSSEAFDSAVSLRCADCHGSTARGGNVPWMINGKKVSWKAPALNTELLRFSEDEVRDIITYGRPGTPMNAWGVKGGGPKNDQSISDLVAFIKSIQLSPDKARKQASGELADATKAAGKQAVDAGAALDAASSALDDARAALRKALNDPSVSDVELPTRCATIESQLEADRSKVDKSLARACRAFLDAVAKQSDAQAADAWAQDWATRRANVGEGQLLFELYCARCHTEGWSTFDTSKPNGTDALGLAGGGGGLGGGIGFNLRDGGEIRRFGSDEDGGFAAQVDFVSNGSEAFKPYGRGGIGSGRMPAFGLMLTPDMIKEIVYYERYCLDQTSYTAVEPACNGSAPRVPATTTTTTKKQG